MNEISTRKQVREDVLELEALMKTHPDQIGQQEGVTHHFAPGNYGREIVMEAGTLVVGKLHKHAHLNFLLEGQCSVVTEHGREDLVAPRVWVSEPGIKRAVYNHTRVRWVTVHPTEETDIEKIEAEVIAPSYDNLLEEL